MFGRIVVVLASVLTGSIALHAQDTPRIWQGVYTAAQAERGKTVFESACIRCHGGDLGGTTAPALKGERFQSSWGGQVIETLFTKIRDTMPPNFGTILDDQAKLDIVAYILQTNGFPAGNSDLVVGGGDLAAAQILKKGEQASVQNFSLVQAVGCLTTGPNNTWMLTRTSEPLPTRGDASPDAASASATRPLGTKVFRLISATQFQPESHKDQKVEARGLIYNEPGEERINLTSLRPTGSSCGG